MTGENYINHIVFVLDGSGSMNPHKNALIKATDEQIKYLAQRSLELGQETRATVYVFDDRTTCIYYEKDVLRMPSISEKYRIGGMTALIDATMQSQEDLAKTAQLYGDHAFLTFVLTDGAENASRRYKAPDLQRTLNNQPDNWTVAVLVPNAQAKFEAKKFGFAPDNIAVWDTTSAAGLSEATNRIRVATDSFMTNRAQGIRSTRSLFSTGIDAVNANTVRQALHPLTESQYRILNVPQKSQIRPFVEGNGFYYSVGKAYYQLSKTEEIQRQKSLAVLEKATGKVYVGDQARSLVGLPDVTVKVKPDHNPEYEVFVQSTSVNRNLMPNTKLLLLV